MTNKNGKNLSPVGFVTFANRLDAETAKQELTVEHLYWRDFDEFARMIHREFDSIRIFLQRYDWNLLNRIPKYKNPNILFQHLSPPPLNSLYRFHVMNFDTNLSIKNSSCSFRRIKRCFLSYGSMGSTFNVRSWSRYSSSSSSLAHYSPWSTDGTNYFYSWIELTFLFLNRV